MSKYLAIDIGGTFIKYSLMNEKYEAQENGNLPTSRVPEEFLRQIQGLVQGYKDRVQGIAVCMAGFINPETGENTDFSVGLNFKTYNIKKELEKIVEVPVLLENDSNCAALGEMVAGAAKTCKDFCMITIGTGIGAALVLEGRLHRGRNFKAGELGFTKVGVPDLKRGIPAEEAGATAVLAKKVSVLLGREVNGAYVMEHLQEPEIRSIYEEWLCKCAVIVGNVAVTFDPEKVLIGGGISENPIFIEDLRKTVYGIYRHLEEYTQIVPCEQGNMAGRVGALYQLLDIMEMPGKERNK